MLRFVLRRVLHSAIVIIGVTAVVFVATRMVGDPVSVILPMDATDAQRLLMAHQLGLDRPIFEQLIDFVRGLASFDLGRSLWQDRPAMTIVLERLPLTLALVGAAMTLGLGLGVPLGVLASMRAGGPADRLTVILSLAGLSMPQFWLGLLLIVLFAVELHWLPSSGADEVAHIILPAVTLALPAIGRIAMLTRSTMIAELNRPYILTAEAKGLSLARIVGVHALVNAAIPVLTLASWELIRMLAGYAVVVETVFAWPGLGFLAIQSIERQDLVLLQAVVLTVALIVVTLTFLTDLAYKAIDPRIELG
ncbi:MAG: ABC transporter permease [Proteobacteria bacterium]|nr:ABC transporter permease [Pseudomonadota bacterium]